MKVLIVDDSPDDISVIQARLAKENLEIFFAEDGVSGIKETKSLKPDLILLDIDMPGMTGFDVCQILKQDGELSSIPIIFLTSSNSTEDKVKGLDLGAVDYISKPFDHFELRARVRAALRTKHMQDLLTKYAQIDPLTELYNRRALMERLENEWARIHRNQGSFAFIMADVDNFKDINDSYGHVVGDEVLVKIGKTLKQECRESDFVARFGGEEFAVLCHDTNIKGAVKLAEKYREVLGNIRINETTEKLQITLSFGISDTIACKSLEDLIRKADHALYEAKTIGRDRIIAAE
ncbi:MAG: diguanylate cyclase [Planctomycetes bacterium]|nr:diguanylate cyclase [Planctomycetota bacterium]